MFNGFMRPVTLELIYETLLVHSNRFDRIDNKFSKMFNKLDKKMDEKFGILDKKIDRVDSKFDRKFDELYKYLDWMKEAIDKGYINHEKRIRTLENFDEVEQQTLSELIKAVKIP